MKFHFSKKIAIGSIIGCGAFIGLVGYIFAATNDVTGYACSQNIGCISLNPQTSSGEPGFANQPSSFAVQYNDTTRTFSGTGWSPLVGLVNFGQTCSAAIQAAQGANATGAKCATVPLVIGTPTAQNGGWDGYIYLGEIDLAPDNIHFVGRGWDGNDTNRDGATPSDTGIGWLTFTATLQGDIGACGIAVNTISAQAPTANLCSVGLASTPTGGGSSYWSWTCTGASSTASCRSLDPAQGVCGTAANTIQTTQPTTGLCAVGTASGMSNSTPYTWVCTGPNNNQVPCTAFTNDMPAACGTATTLCSIGSLVPGSIQNFANGASTWQCTGLGSYATVPLVCNSSGTNATTTTATSTPGILKPIYKEN